jgi:hypothetical protein
VIIMTRQSPSRLVLLRHGKSSDCEFARNDWMRFHIHAELQRFDMAGLLAIVVLLCLLGLFAQGGLKAMEARLLPRHVRG